MEGLIYAKVCARRIIFRNRFSSPRRGQSIKISSLSAVRIQKPIRLLREIFELSMFEPEQSAGRFTLSLILVKRDTRPGPKTHGRQWALLITGPVWRSIPKEGSSMCPLVLRFTISTEGIGEVTISFPIRCLL